MSRSVSNIDIPKQDAGYCHAFHIMHVTWQPDLIICMMHMLQLPRMQIVSCHSACISCPTHAMPQSDWLKPQQHAQD